MFTISLAAISVALSILGVMVFRWEEHTIWFVVGVDLLYALAFITFLQHGQNELERKKEALTEKCQCQKEEDAAALAEEEKDYVEHIGQEYQYFEFVNMIRLLSRELFTKVDPSVPKAAAHRIDAILLEVRDKFFHVNDAFCSRFLNEELRNDQFYEDGSSLRHLATVKEVFATHILLLWMAVKCTSGSLRNKLQGADEDTKSKLEFIKSTVASLLSYIPMLEQIRDIAQEVAEENRNIEGIYTVNKLRSILENFEHDSSPQEDTDRLVQLQGLYIVLHKYFMGKAGNYDEPFELAQDALDFLFTQEVQKSEKLFANKGSESEILQDDEGFTNTKTKVNQQLTMTGHGGRKDFVLNAVGEHRDDHIEVYTDESKMEGDDDDEAILADGNDFAFLKEEALSHRPQDWSRQDLGKKAPAFI